MTVPAGILSALEAALPADGLLTDAADLRTYECDGLTGRRVIPAAVCLPETTEQVQSVVRACAAHRIPFVARGAGTGLSGGALPVAEGVVIALARMNSVLRSTWTRSGSSCSPASPTSGHRGVAVHGLYYAPDPSSQQVCSIGGNVAENSGGAHCLKYGFTVNHVTGMTSCSPMATGRIGGPASSLPADLPGVFVGSEGTLGIATEITLRLMRRPEAVRDAARRLRLHRRGRRGRVGNRSPRDPAGGDGDDGPADDPGRRGRGHAGYRRTPGRS